MGRDQNQPSKRNHTHYVCIQNRLWIFIAQIIPAHFFKI